MTPPAAVKPAIVPPVCERTPPIVPALKLPIKPPTCVETPAVPMLPELLNDPVPAPDNVPPLMLPSKPPTFDVPVTAPEFANKPVTE